MNVLLSIKPEFVEKIFNKEKLFEYRKTIFRQRVDKVIIYSTMPEGKIVGEFRVVRILHDDPEHIWELTNNKSGISYSFFHKYFSQKKEAYAIQIGELEKYENPIDPREFDFHFTAPQSFFYVDDNCRPIGKREDLMESTLF
ncbi:hypothetical protein [Paenibacillus sp. Y412MC10]|uniref:hypothetical protein n=1 Tax=Geobacillus sp. (strain Y412MC10) TaxID=481743 RepID=UPI0011A008CA|nr:hypothetical protein [Paenibacillus sp. Y412MC10]